MESQNEDSESINQHREQPRGTTSENQQMGRRYRDINDLLTRRQNINVGFSGAYNPASYAYGVQSDYNSSSN
jgi:hypothetical protein